MLIKKLISDHLYGNSLWLIIDSLMITGFGFFFWTINTRLFSPDEIGIATSLIAAAELIAIISILGFDIALIRYIPESRQINRRINSCFLITGLTALGLSLFFVLNIELFSPKLDLLTNTAYAASFSVFVVFIVVFWLLKSVFIGLRKSKFILATDGIFSMLKLVFPFFLVFLGAYGIFSSWMISLMIAFLVGLFFIDYRPKLVIDISIIKKMLRFSSANYIANFLSRAPQYILPLMITNLINPTTTAYFYISWMIATVLFTVPIAVSKTLLAEGSANKSDLAKKVVKSLKFTYVILVPAVIVTIVLAKYILLLFGSEYSENAFRFLQVLALSSLPLGINVIFISIKNLEHKMATVITVNLLIAASYLILSTMLLSHGLVMVGVAWLGAQTMVAVYSTVNILEMKKNV